MTFFKINRVFIILQFYWHVVILKNDNWKHFYKKQWRTGNCFTSFGEGWEIVNGVTDKTVMRKGVYTENLHSSGCTWNKINLIFLKNINND